MYKFTHINHQTLVRKAFFFIVPFNFQLSTRNPNSTWEETFSNFSNVKEMSKVVTNNMSLNDDTLSETKIPSKDYSASLTFPKESTCEQRNYYSHDCCLKRISHKEAFIPPELEIISVQAFASLESISAEIALWNIPNPPTLETLDKKMHLVNLVETMVLNPGKAMYAFSALTTNPV